MKTEQIAVLVDAIRKGPPSVIGFDRNGPSQEIFDQGWNAAKEQIWTELQAAGLLPGPKETKESDL